ncbi:MAG: 7-carboxy-7-deazaguanine synthase QueE [Acidobacteriaceae bacterium]|nr:7-carboxy-7-deazaguanine synthase QueE [Acidobacteriaceae bacterium]
MKISEIFYSIQGEGALLGVPSVFVRTSGCNLRCTWSDTPYTSCNPEGKDLKLHEILEQIEAFKAAHVVVTGGEPMIAPQIVVLTERLRASGLHITIETAGTVYSPVACDLMSISPKLANSIPIEREHGRWAAQHDRLRSQPEVLRQLTSSYPFQLKFVVSSPEDLAEIKNIQSACDANPAQVILMPEGTSRDLLRERALWIAEICKETGYRLSPRLHVDLWGDRRGV